MDPAALTFRSATLADAEAVVALVESAYRGEKGKEGWTTETDLLDGQRTDLQEVSSLITRPNSRLLLAELGSVRVGCCHVERQGKSCYFGMFSVKPTSQGVKIGRAVLGEAERFAEDEWLCHTMTMTVIDIRSELIQWYERRGYRRTGKHKPFPYDDPRAGIPKRDDLRFEVLTKALGV